jgi:hypothetical protein
MHLLVPFLPLTTWRENAKCRQFRPPSCRTGTQRNGESLRASVMNKGECRRLRAIDMGARLQWRAMATGSTDT